MKKFAIMAVLAVSAIALSQQQAQAWINCKWGVGVNWHWQSGGNNFFWGMFTNGQPPGPDFGGGFGPEIVPHGYGHGHGYAPQMAPATGNPTQNVYYYTQPTYQNVSYPGYYTMPSYYYPVSGYYGR